MRLGSKNLITAKSLVPLFLQISLNSWRHSYKLLGTVYNWIPYLSTTEKTINPNDLKEQSSYLFPKCSSSFLIQHSTIV